MHPAYAGKGKVIIIIMVMNRASAISSDGVVLRDTLSTGGSWRRSSSIVLINVCAAADVSHPWED